MVKTHLMWTRLLLVLSVVLLLSLSLSLVACSSSSTSSAPATTAAAPQASQAAAKPITLVFSTNEASGGTFATTLYKPWFDELEKRTNGRVKVEAHYNSELVQLPDAYQAVQKGTVDFAQVMQMMVPGKFPMDEINSFISFDTYNYCRGRTYWELMQAFPQMQDPYKDVKVLWVGTVHESGLGTTKKPMKTLDDMKGMKFLAYGQWQSARIEALGMVPVSMGPTELVSNLEKGVIDGSVVALFTMDDMKLGDVIKYITLIPQPAPSIAVLMNQKTWNSLPSDIQKIMNDMIPGLVDVNDVSQVQAEKQYKGIAASKYGVQFFDLPAAELSKIAALDKPVKDKYVADLESKGLPGKDFMNKFLELEKKYSDPKYAPK